MELQEQNSKHLVSFGVLTDVQYADRDDNPSWCCKEKMRYYRNSLNLIRKAYQTWEDHSHRVKFAIQLGDLLDGSNFTMDLNSTAAILKLLKIFAEFPNIPTYHVLGNHELYNFNRLELEKFFGLAFSGKLDTMNTHIPNEDKRTCDTTETEPSLAYYSFSPVPEILIIVLDCFDISLPGYDPNHAKYKEAETFLKQYHTAENKDLWEYDDHLIGLDKRFLSYNGALGNEQMQWLDRELQSADHLHQKVIICGHVAILPESTHDTCVMWNYKEILDLIHRHDSVIAYLAGHLHDSGYAKDAQGIHHISFAGIIETPPDSNAFGTVHVYDNHIYIEGHGREKSYFLPYCKTIDIEDHPVSCSGMEVKVIA